MIVLTVSQQDPNRVVQVFIDLIARHEQSFYSFIHKVHSKGEGLFDGLMRWIELFLTAFREGFGDPISLEFLLPHTGQERVDIMKEVDEVALYHYKLKLAHQNKVRKRFGRTQGRNDADAEDEAAQILLNGVVQDIDFGELVKGDVDELEAAEDEEDEDSDEDDSEEESSEEESTDEEGPESVTPRMRSMTLDSSPRPPEGHGVQRAGSVQSVSVPSRSQSLRSQPSVQSMSRLQQQPSQLSLSKVPGGLSSSANPTTVRRQASMASVQTAGSQNVGSGSGQAAKGNKPTSPRPVTYPRKPKKSTPALSPPELKRIPELLPVFVELVKFQHLSTDFKCANDVL